MELMSRLLLLQISVLRIEIKKSSLELEMRMKLTQQIEKC